MENNKIIKWEELTNKIVEDWICEVFILDDEEILYLTIDWVSDSVGGVFNFGDYFIGFDTVLDYYKHNLTPEKFFSWYDFCLSNQKVNISLSKFILSPKEKKEQLKKQLEQSKQRLKEAEETFKKSLEEFNKVKDNDRN